MADAKLRARLATVPRPWRGEPTEEVVHTGLTGLPDNLFALVLTAIDQPQAVGRMLATCRRVRALVAPGGLGV